jgi:hypothetical protein
MSDGERRVITILRTLSADVIKEKGIAIRLLATDEIEYLVQLPFNEASGLTEMITIALTTAKHSTRRHKPSG